MGKLVTEGDGKLSPSNMFKSQQEISGLLIDHFTKVFQYDEFENKYEWVLIRFIAGWIDITYELVEGNISPSVADEQYHRIASGILPRFYLPSPILLKYLDFIYEYRKNVLFLFKSRVKDSNLYISAKPQSYEPSKLSISPYYDVLKYFANNPLSSYVAASTILDVHPTTVSRIYKKLQSLFNLRIGYSTNRWYFGLRTFILFFELHSESDIKEILETITSFPFLSVISKDSNNGHHYVGFNLPSDEDIINQFRCSITKYSANYFKSWRLHELIGNEIGKWSENIAKDGFQIPRIIIEDSFPPILENDYKPTSYKFNTAPELTFHDFLVFHLSSYDLRKSAKEIAKSPIAIANDINCREMYYRRRKVLEKGVMIPYSFWDHVHIHTLRLEVICGEKSSYSLISAAKECTTFYYGLTSEGLILFLNIAISHLNAYVQYFRSLLGKLGVNDYRFSFSKYWTSSVSLMDIVVNWNYGPKGFTVQGLDISANIFDYSDL